jgi:hypothetical protein
MWRRSGWFVLAMALAVAGFGGCDSKKPEAAAPAAAASDSAKAAEAVAAASAAATEAKEKEALEVAIDAYIYGYPLVTMEYTRRVSTNVAEPSGSSAPMGRFAPARKFLDASYRDVTAPNADTLYNLGWFDISKEPLVISLPDLKGRYALFPMLNAWTTVFEVPGKRTTGTAAQAYAVTGPGWSGTLPDGMIEYKAGTGFFWFLGRISSTGTPADLKQVHAIQDKISAVPLSAYGKPYTPPAATVDPAIDMKTPPRDQVHALDAAAYFKLLAELLKTNPPSADDAPMVERMARIGLVPGQDFDATKLDATVAKGIAGAVKPAQQQIIGWFTKGIASGDNALINGWVFTTKTGVYGTNYIQRALVTWVGLGANRPQDAIYPTSETDTEGKPYSGANKYVLRFDKGQLPPVEGFWSLTMYDGDYFFVPNPLNRYNLNSRDKLKANADGSVELIVQADSPGKAKESNWLPAPRGKFVLMLRMYWPNEKPPSILDGSWKPPPATLQ